MKKDVTQILMDNNTGEVLKATPGVFTPKEELEKWHEFYRIKEKFREQGSFVWLLYKRVEELSLSISPASLTRLAYLSTYMNYDNRLVKDEPENKWNIEETISKQYLMEIMHLPRNTFYRFYKEVTEAKILIETEAGYYLNETYFRKGALGRKHKNGRMRLYVKGIRDLYNKSEIKDHKMLGYGFMIIPYVNIEYNVLCWNPEEKERFKVKPMAISDMMDVLGLDTTSVAKFRKSILEIMVGKYQLFHTFDDEGLIVSPYVYYAGKNRPSTYMIDCFKNGIF